MAKQIEYRFHPVQISNPANFESELEEILEAEFISGWILATLLPAKEEEGKFLAIYYRIQSD